MRVSREFKRQPPGVPYSSDGLTIELTPEELGLEVTEGNWKEVLEQLLKSTWYVGMVDLVRSGHQTTAEAQNSINKYREKCDRSTKDKEPSVS